MTPLPDRDVITPLGPATLIGYIDNIDNPEWVTFIKATGEPWFWPNHLIRFANSVTNSRPSTSPFFNLPPKMHEQIERYRQHGWLEE